MSSASSNQSPPLSLRALLAAISLTAATPLCAVTVVNGSFEDLSSSYSNTPSTDSMSAVAADGWSISSNTPDWFLGAPGPAGLWLTSWGDLFTMGAAEGITYREGISQAITGLTVGESYLLSFQQANGLLFDQVNYDGVGNIGGWEVLLDGLSILTSPSLNDNSTPSPAFTSEWNASTAVFVATATSQTIEFLAYGSTPSDPTFQFLDDVTVDPIPEPSAALLALLGGLPLLARRRNSRRESRQN